MFLKFWDLTPVITRKETTKSPKEEERRLKNQSYRLSCIQIPWWDLPAIRIWNQLKKKKEGKNPNAKPKTLYIENKMSLKKSLAVYFEPSSLLPTVSYYNNIFFPKHNIVTRIRINARYLEGEKEAGGGGMLHLQDSCSLLETVNISSLFSLFQLHLLPGF